MACSSEASLVAGLPRKGLSRVCPGLGWETTCPAKADAYSMGTSVCDTCTDAFEAEGVATHAGESVDIYLSTNWACMVIGSL